MKMKKKITTSQSRKKSQVRPTNLDERWDILRRKIEQAANDLRTQGAVVARRVSKSRVWVVRYRTHGEDGRKLRSLYIGSDEQIELLQRTRRLLAEIRGRDRWPRDVTGYAHLARSISALMRRLAGQRSK